MADKSGAGWALILGEQEVADGTATVKPLRHEAEQQTLAEADLMTYLQGLVAAGDD